MRILYVCGGSIFNKKIKMNYFIISSRAINYSPLRKLIRYINIIFILPRPITIDLFRVDSLLIFRGLQFYTRANPRKT